MTTTNERGDADRPADAPSTMHQPTPGSGTPSNAASGNTTPSSGLSSSAIPSSATSSNATPGSVTPGGATSGSGTPGSGTRGTATSGNATSGSGAPDTATSGSGTSGSATSGSATPGSVSSGGYSGDGARGVAGRAAREFQLLHGCAPAGVWSAPGRVNLIGEHTDYNDGFVLPFALPFRIAVAASPRADGMLTITTVGDDGRPQQAGPVAVDRLAPGGVDGWAAYPSGVAWVLRDEGFAGGADLVIVGDVPAGAGLSSSHALQCATALALLGLGGVELDSEGAPSRTTIARWVQRSENDFVGVPTGLLDQTASLSCVRSHVLFLDVRSGAMEQVPFDASSAGLAVLVIDTRAKHSHNESGYRERRAGCERAASLLGVPALRDVTADGLDDALAKLPGELRPLVRHVVTENTRVERTVEHMRAGRIADIGDLLTASHTSLRDDYRVSCLELDVAVDAALDAGALGARMTGGGFGGSAIALVRADETEVVGRRVAAAFADRGLTAPGLFTAVPSPGASRDN